MEIVVGSPLSDVKERYLLPIDRWLGEAEAPDTARALGMTLGMMPLQPIVGSVTGGGPAEVAQLLMNLVQQQLQHLQ